MDLLTSEEQREVDVAVFARLRLHLQLLCMFCGVCVVLVGVGLLGQHLLLLALELLDLALEGDESALGFLGLGGDLLKLGLREGDLGGQLVLLLKQDQGDVAGCVQQVPGRAAFTF